MICQIRTHKECSCEAHECRAQHIGTFHKPRVQEIVQDTFPGSHLVILIAVIGALGFSGAASYNAYEGYKARVNQEIVKW